MIRAVLPCALAALCGCLPNSTIEGLEFGCDAGTQCNPGLRCWRGVCTEDAGWRLGTACAGDEDCENGICSDGVCCSRRCDGPCESCQLGALGQCDPLPAGDPGTPSCAPYHCDGTNNLCPGGCAAPGDCGAGTYCDAGACTALQSLGTTCSGGGACDSGLCVDNRCCNTTCANPCDACDVAGRLGTCSVSPLGRIPFPACGLYACNGASVLCPGSCTSDAGCVPPNSCSSSQQRCQPKVSALVDAFPAGIDAGTWVFYQDPDTMVAGRNGRLELLVDAGIALAYCGIYTARTYDATSSQTSVQLVAVGTQSLGLLETYFQLLAPDNLNRFGLDLNGGQVVTQEQIGGVYSYPSPAVAYNPAVHKYFRLRLSGNTAFLESSSNGGNYSAIGSTSAKPWMQSTYVELGSGRWNPEDAGSFAAFDNVAP
ncbi:MAG TPA: hypothetical protein VFA20_13160 [Myxococcaceae bacterium]|nr:hypothetical protein [Myxococcaceae bacterium]